GRRPGRTPRSGPLADRTLRTGSSPLRRRCPEGPPAAAACRPRHPGARRRTRARTCGGRRPRGERPRRQAARARPQAAAPPAALHLGASRAERRAGRPALRFLLPEVIPLDIADRAVALEYGPRVLQTEEGAERAAAKGVGHHPVAVAQHPQGALA